MKQTSFLDLPPRNEDGYRLIECPTCKEKWYEDEVEIAGACPDFCFCPECYQELYWESDGRVILHSEYTCFDCQPDEKFDLNEPELKPWWE